MTWQQNYDPMGLWPLSTAISALPVLTLFFVLLVLKKRAWIAALSGMAMAIVLAALVFRMPVPLIAAASLNGFVFGFFRIGWIIIASIFLYNIAVETGQFQVMKESIAGVSSDQRIQLILIAFCFGAFLEGTGGGGAPVAVAGSFLIGLGFPPFQAATACLLANTAPVAWGGVGNPIRVLAGVTAIDEAALNAMTGRILPPFSFILPFWLVISSVGWRRAKGVWPALFVSGASFATMQFFWSNFGETGLVDIVSGIFALLVMVAFLRVWRPSDVVEVRREAPELLKQHSLGAIIKGWSPFILASVLIFLYALPAVARFLVIKGLTLPMPLLDKAVYRVPPVVSLPTPEPASLDLNAIALPGTAVFLGAFLAVPLLGMPMSKAFSILRRSFRELIPSMLAISFMVGLAYVSKYCGMDTVMGLSLTHTGWIYPFFGTLLGWLGVALTGTDAGSNALFGNLQKVTAEQLGVSPTLMASANSAGGVMGKMIAAPSIVVSSAATRQEGNEAAIFRSVIGHSIVLASLVGLLVMVYAYLTPWIVPGA
jgi:lactate permease